MRASRPTKNYDTGQTWKPISEPYFRNLPRGKSGTVSSSGTGPGTGLCRVHRPAVGQTTGRGIAEGKQAPDGTGSDSDRTGQELARVELRPHGKLNTNSGNFGISSSKDPP